MGADRGEGEPVNNNRIQSEPMLTCGTKLDLSSFTPREGEVANKPIITLFMQDPVHSAIAILTPEKAIQLAAELVDHAIKQQQFCVDLFWDEVNSGV